MASTGSGRNSQNPTLALKDDVRRLDIARYRFTSQASSAAAAAPNVNPADLIRPHALHPQTHSPEPPLKIECRRFDKGEWDGVLAGFRDANLYQAWSYAAVRWGGKNLHPGTTQLKLGLCGKLGRTVNSSGVRKQALEQTELAQQQYLLLIDLFGFKHRRVRRVRV